MRDHQSWPHEDRGHQGQRGPAVGGVGKAGFVDAYRAAVLGQRDLGMNVGQQAEQPGAKGHRGPMGHVVLQHAAHPRPPRRDRHLPVRRDGLGEQPGCPVALRQQGHHPPRQRTTLPHLREILLQRLWRYPGQGLQLDLQARLRPGRGGVQEVRCPSALRYQCQQQLHVHVIEQGADLVQPGPVRVHRARLGQEAQAGPHLGHRRERKPGVAEDVRGQPELDHAHSLVTRGSPRRPNLSWATPARQ